MKFSSSIIISALAVLTISSNVDAQACDCAVDPKQPVTVVLPNCPTDGPVGSCDLDQAFEHPIPTLTTCEGTTPMCTGYATEPDRYNEVFVDVDVLVLLSKSDQVPEPEPGTQVGCPAYVPVVCWKCGDLLDCIIDDKATGYTLSKAAKQSIVDFITIPESLPPGYVDSEVGGVPDDGNTDFCIAKKEGDVNNLRTVYETEAQQFCETTVAGLTSEVRNDGTSCCVGETRPVNDQKCPVPGNENGVTDTAVETVAPALRRALMGKGVPGLSNIAIYKIPMTGPCGEPNPEPVVEPEEHGDPHFTTWGGEHFDFQGACDLVMIDNPGYKNDKSLYIHGRSVSHGAWSSMSSVAVKIGDDILEVHGESAAMINGIEFPVQEVAGTEYQFPMKIGGYDLSVQIFGPHSRRFVIHMGDGEKIHVSNFKYIVNVELKHPRSADFEGSVGIWGTYSQHGAMMARDGKTHVEDEDAFGQEWQVNDSDPQLFHVIDGPQYPSKCAMPEKATANQRHLRAMNKKVSEDDAKKACSKASAAQMQNCIADVFGADDLEMAQIYEDLRL